LFEETNKSEFCAWAEGPKIKKIANKPQNLFQKNISLLLRVNLQTIKRKTIHVLKPAFTTKAITEIVAAANSTDEIVAGSNGAS
jgi:hypothetical protein